MVTVNVVVLAGTVAADPVQRRMPSGDEVTELRLSVPEAGRRLLPLAVATCGGRGLVGIVCVEQARLASRCEFRHLLEDCLGRCTSLDRQLLSEVDDGLEYGRDESRLLGGLRSDTIESVGIATVDCESQADDRGPLVGLHTSQLSFGLSALS